jgi:hypothetical protein
MVNTIIILPNFPFIMFYYYFINQTKMVKLIYSPPTPHPIIYFFFHSLSLLFSLFYFPIPQITKYQHNTTTISSSKSLSFILITERYITLHYKTLRFSISTWISFSEHCFFFRFCFSVQYEPETKIFVLF